MGTWLAPDSTRRRHHDGNGGHSTDLVGWSCASAPCQSCSCYLYWWRVGLLLYLDRRLCRIRVRRGHDLDRRLPYLLAERREQQPVTAGFAG